MSKKYYALVITGALMILAGVIIQIIIETCYDKAPSEFFNDPICRIVNCYK